MIHAIRGGADAAKILTRLSRNSISTVSHDLDAPEELRTLDLDFASQGDGLCTWDQYLLTEDMAECLLVRLQLGGFVLGSNSRRLATSRSSRPRRSTRSRLALEKASSRSFT